jgi:hypothetical protein
MAVGFEFEVHRLHADLSKQECMHAVLMSELDTLSRHVPLLR